MIFARWALLELVVLAVLTVLDAGGALIYFGYWTAFMLGLAFLGISALIFRGPEGRFPLRELLPSVALLALMTSLLVHLPTSPRKRFFLAANRLYAGMSLADAETVMRPFDPHPFWEGRSSVTFSFRSSPGTTDSAIVTLAKDGRHILSVEFSPD